MKSHKKMIIIALLLVGLMALPLASFANGFNTLTIISMDNKALHHLDQRPSDGGVPHKGITFRIWQLPDRDGMRPVNEMLTELKDLTVAMMDAKYPNLPPTNSPLTDITGTTVFRDLPDGYYYVRAVNQKGTEWESDWHIVPFLVKLPYIQIDGTQTSAITVYPKGSIPEKPDEPEKPPTGGERFVKVSASKEKPLEGASFKVVVRVVDDRGEEVTDSKGAYVYKAVMVDGKELLVRSGADGRFEVTGLPYGVYYLIETVAPQGYLGLIEPLAFTVDATSYDDTAIIKIINKEGPLPSPPDEETPEVPPTPPTPPTPPKPPSPPKPPVKPGIQVPETGDITVFIAMVTGGLFIGLGTYFYKDSVQTKEKANP